MINIKEPVGAIYTYVETDENGEFRRLYAKVTHVIEVDVEGVTVVFSDSVVAPIDYLAVKDEELRDAIIRRLESTLKSVTENANNLRRIIDKLEDIATATDCRFDITVNKDDC
jgi:hypothetical protein